MDEFVKVFGKLIVLTLKRFPGEKLRLILLAGVIVLLVSISSCTSHTQSTNKLTIYVAVSLTEVVSEIVSEYEKLYGIEVDLNIASSGTLARQLEEGGICDMYFSASKRWMEYSLEKHLIDTASLSLLASNSLVLISPKNNSNARYHSLTNLPDSFKGRISIGDPTHVPAGRYATEALKSLNVFTALEKRLLPAKDVRSALMVVEMGECEYGIVYKTDALKSEKIKIDELIPDSLHSPIHYYVAVAAGSEHKESAKKLLTYITGDSLKSIWQDYGFGVNVYERYGDNQKKDSHE